MRRIALGLSLVLWADIATADRALVIGRDNAGEIYSFFSAPSVNAEFARSHAVQQCHAHRSTIIGTCTHIVDFAGTCVAVRLARDNYYAAADQHPSRAEQLAARGCATHGSCPRFDYACDTISSERIAWNAPQGGWTYVRSPAQQAHTPTQPQPPVVAEPPHAKPTWDRVWSDTKALLLGLLPSWMYSPPRDPIEYPYAWLEGLGFAIVVGTIAIYFLPLGALTIVALLIFVIILHRRLATLQRAQQVPQAPRERATVERVMREATQAAASVNPSPPQAEEPESPLSPMSQSLKDQILGARKRHSEAPRQEAAARQASPEPRKRGSVLSSNTYEF